jgi:hypothetical protein
MIAFLEAARKAKPTRPKRSAAGTSAPFHTGYNHARLF